MWEAFKQGQSTNPSVLGSFGLRFTLLGPVAINNDTRFIAFLASVFAMGLRALKQFRSFLEAVPLELGK